MRPHVTAHPRLPITRKSPPPGNTPAMSCLLDVQRSVASVARLALIKMCQVCKSKSRLQMHRDVVGLSFIVPKSGPFPWIKRVKVHLNMFRFRVVLGNKGQNSL